MIDRLRELQRLSNFLLSLYDDFEIGILRVYNPLELSSSGRQGRSNGIDNSSYSFIMCFPLQELSYQTKVVYSVSYGTYLVFPRIEYFILTFSQQAKSAKGLSHLLFVPEDENKESQTSETIGTRLSVIRRLRQSVNLFMKQISLRLAQLMEQQLFRYSSSGVKEKPCFVCYPLAQKDPISEPSPPPFESSWMRRKRPTSSTSNVRVECNLFAEVEALSAGADHSCENEGWSNPGSLLNQPTLQGKRLAR